MVNPLVRVAAKALARLGATDRARTAAKPGAADWATQRATWKLARPALIDAALARAQARPAGNWYVLAASTLVRGDRPFGRTVAGVEVVAWRGTDGTVHAGPGACPHLGAPLCHGRVYTGNLVCRWHGLSLGARRTPDGARFPRTTTGYSPGSGWTPSVVRSRSTRPYSRRRPALERSIAAVTAMPGVCEPADVVANRLDPWHGAWFHPYSFTDLTVVSAPAEDATEADDRFVVDVAFRVGPRHGVRYAPSSPRRSRAPWPCTSWPGRVPASVVETHATPLGTDGFGRARTAVVEATVACSGRTGFGVARRAAPLVRAMVRYGTRRLWADDLAYAERRYARRTASER